MGEARLGTMVNIVFYARFERNQKRLGSAGICFTAWLSLRVLELAWWVNVASPPPVSQPSEKKRERIGKQTAGTPTEKKTIEKKSTLRGKKGVPTYATRRGKGNESIIR
jgi:hypothetical protein